MSVGVGIFIFLCLMLISFLAAVALTIWLIVDILREKREEKDKDE